MSGKLEIRHHGVRLRPSGEVTASGFAGQHRGDTLYLPDGVFIVDGVRNCGDDLRIDVLTLREAEVDRAERNLRGMTC
ncbi:MAG: hypothetical protein MUE50_03965 [Pirellulaceae bacterium]|jgi:hypothetical protein|nr:hypothetical protein [Pirellulaceae bacterium]